jgi:dTDP-glucose 4,6-dehydratase
LISRGERPILYGRGENIRDWIHVEDHVKGVWAVLEKGSIGETYLFGADCERQNRQVVDSILKAHHIPSDYVTFVKDRPGHDLRYAISALKAQKMLGWEPRQSFDLFLMESGTLHA